MSQLQEYKCPCCGGAIAFDSTAQKMVCPYCDTEFEMETLASYDEVLNSEQEDNLEWETEAGSEWDDGETDGLREYVCKSCGGVVKPWVVLYGEAPDKYTCMGACREISNCDTLIVAGTSLAVEPAASFLDYFKGRELVVINKEETPADARATLVLREDIAEVMDSIRV